MRFERALIRLCARRLTRYPRWSAARTMRSRALVDTLAPGVNARETAERETPARLATSAAVTNARRAECWPTSKSRFARACIILSPECTRVQAAPIERDREHVVMPPEASAEEPWPRESANPPPPLRQPAPCPRTTSTDSHRIGPARVRRDTRRETRRPGAIAE